MDYNPTHAGLEGLLDLDGEILVITEEGHYFFRDVDAWLEAQ